MYFVIVSVLLAFRVGLFVYFVVTEGHYLSPDSAGYINLATNLLDHQIFSSSVKLPFELDFFRTPGYPFFLAILKCLGIESPYWVVFWQELLYGISLWLFYHYGQSLFGKKIVRASLLFLLIEPGGFAYPKLFLSETLFLPFSILGILLIGHYLKKKDWRYLVFSGFIMGLGILIRPVLLYFPIIVCFTLIAFDYRSKRCWLHAGLLLLSVTLTVSPWLVRNQYSFGKLAISGQQSNMFTYYHVPIIWEFTRAISFRTGQKIMENKVKTELDIQKKLMRRPLTEIETYQIQQNIAFKEIRKYPVEYVKQWVFGIFKTMMGMSLTEVYQVMKIKPNRVRFFIIKENNFSKKIWFFLKSQDVFVIFMVIIRGVISIFALLGAIAIIRSKDCFLWLFMLANFYFICMPGPMGTPRFRFPVEGFWFVQAYFGFIWVFNRGKRFMPASTS